MPTNEKSMSLHGDVSEIHACVFCEIVAGRLPARIVYEDENFLAFFPLEHINPGHVLLVLRRHVDYLFDLDEQDYTKLWSVAARLARPLKEAMAAERIGVAVEGFTVSHVHVHLVPVYGGDELNPARARALDRKDADRLHGLIRDAIGNG